MEAWIGVIAGLVAGAAIGVGVMLWRARRGAGGASIEGLKRENEKFRDEVTEHFVETARLINQMTDSYKAVFDHLSQGADKLVDDQALAERMPRVSDQEVRLRHLGAPESDRGRAGDGKSTAGKENSQGSKPTDGDDPLRRSASGERQAPGRGSKRR